MSSSETLSRAPVRIKVALLVILVVGILLGARLFYWQIVQWDRLSRLAERQSLVDVPVPARRGDILTSDHLLVATDVYQFTVRISPADVPDHEALAKKLAPILKVPEATLLNQLKSESKSILLARDLPVEIGQAVQDFKLQNEITHPELGLASLQIEVRTARRYPAAGFAAQTIGYVNAERHPAYGVEQYKDEELSGTDGVIRGAGDALHDIIPIDLPTHEPAIDGSTITLTINSAMQKIAEGELTNAIQTTRAQGGMVLVMDPKTGAILALAIYPTADLNQYYEPANQDRYINSAVSGQYEPGSVFKVVTVASALDARTISTASSFDDNGTFLFGGIAFRNHNDLAPGHVSLLKVMEQSLNVEAAKIAVGLGAERFYQYVHKFGFGVPTRVDIAGEVAGMVRVPGDGKWRDSDLATNSFGQGISVTPLQMAAAIGCVANQGKLMRPYVVQQVQRPDGKVITTEPQVVRQVISPDTALTMTQLLADSITVESTNKAIVPGYRIAGKTGTASIPTIAGYDPVWTIASFAGYLPADDPHFVILVRLDKPQTSEWGSQVASPVFASVAQQLVALVALPPDAIRLAGK